MTHKAAFFLSLSLLACSATTAAPRNNSGAVMSRSQAALDGRDFAVEGAMPSGEPERVDLAFANGMLDSSACRAQGLPPVPYVVTREGGTLAFHAERHGDSATDTWTGRVDGQNIEGTFVSTKSAGPSLMVAFRGQAR